MYSEYSPSRSPGWLSSQEDNKRFASKCNGLRGPPHPRRAAAEAGREKWRRRDSLTRRSSPALDRATGELELVREYRNCQSGSGASHATQGSQQDKLEEIVRPLPRLALLAPDARFCLARACRRR